MLKKTLSIFLCIFMLASILLINGVAEDPTYTVSSVGINRTGDTTFEIDWGSCDPTGAYLTSVTVGNVAATIKTEPYTMKVDYVASIDASNSPVGKCTVKMTFGWDGTDKTYSCTDSFGIKGTSKINISGKLTSANCWLITFKDDSGYPIPSCPSSVEFVAPGDSTPIALYSNQSAYEDGTVTVNLDGYANGTKFTCTAHDFSDEYVDYTGSSLSLTLKSAETTVAKATTAEAIKATTKKVEPTTKKQLTEKTEKQQEEDSSTAETIAQLPTLETMDTDTTVTAPSYDLVTGATTTKAKKDMVLSNLMADTQIIKTSGITIKDFDKRGRIGLSVEDYKTLTENYGGTLFGLITSSAYSPVTKELIQGAKTGDAFKSCNVDTCQSFTFGLALRFVLEDKKGMTVTDVSQMEKNVMFELEIPVPDSMKKCKTFGIAMTGEGVITPLTEIKADGGILKFRTPCLGYYTLVGFKEGEAAIVTATSSPLKILVFILFAIGVLLLLAMGFFIYWFFIRPKHMEKDYMAIFGEDNEEDENANSDEEPSDPIEEESTENPLVEEEVVDDSLDNDILEEPVVEVEEPKVKETPIKAKKAKPIEDDDDPFYHLMDDFKSPYVKEEEPLVPLVPSTPDPEPETVVEDIFDIPMEPKEELNVPSPTIEPVIEESPIINQPTQNNYYVPRSSVSDDDIDAIINDVMANRGPSASETIANDGEDIFGLNR